MRIKPGLRDALWMATGAAMLLAVISLVGIDTVVGVGLVAGHWHCAAERLDK